MEPTETNKDKSVVVLLSGGIDSVTLLRSVHRTHAVRMALSFDYGARHNHCELPFAAWQAAQIGVTHATVPLQDAFRNMRSALLSGGDPIPDGHYAEATMQQTVVPFRNGILLSIAAGIAESIGAQALAIAAHAGDHAIYPDCRPPFIEAMRRAIECGTYAGITILCPFQSETKADIIRHGHALGVDFSQTWSCYKGGEHHCGTCGTCVERREAFLLAGVNDPTAYINKPPLPHAP